MNDYTMNIIFIINSLEDRGGTERVASLLANELSTFYRITILSRQVNTLANAYYLNDRVTDIKFQGNSWYFINQCKQYIYSNHPDIVIIHTMSKLTSALLLSGIKTKNIWSLEHISYDSHAWIFKQLRKRLYSKLDVIVTLTNDDAVNYKRFSNNVKIIANATPLKIKKISHQNNSKIIVSIGRLTYQKGYDYLIRAWSLVEKIYPDWSLHIYGEGESREKLEQMVRNNKLRNIRLKRMTNNVQNVYDNTAFYVMSSRFEGLPVVLIEAQSRGLPIVSFNCPSGPAEIISEGIDGYLVENGNVEMLAERIGYLIDNDSIRQVFSANALISAKRFEPDQIINQWITLIDDECKRNK